MKKGNDKLFDINEAAPPHFSAAGLDREAFPKKLLSYCGNNSLKNVVIDNVPPRHDTYTIVNDRGPTAIDAPLSRRLPRDHDVQESFRINDHFTPPTLGFPCKLTTRSAFVAQWTVAYQAACGTPAEQRDSALADFGRAFSAEVSLIASYIVRKVALADLSAADGTPVGSSYSSALSFSQFVPRLRHGEFGHQPVLPGSTITAASDACLESAPASRAFIFSGIRYEITNNRTSVAFCGSHESAMKLASHRLAGVSAVTMSNVAFLHQAPCATVDYCGYRVFATGVLPVPDSSPVLYGSRANGNDENDPYQKQDEQAVAAAQEVGACLNIRGHWVGTSISSRQFLYTNGDLCIQRGLDNRLYVVSGQERLFPPTTTNNRIFRNGYMYRRMRPELVKHSKKSKSTKMPLSSDAFSNFGVVRADEHEREVALMTEVLKQQILTDATNRILQHLMMCEGVSEGMDVLQRLGGLSCLLHRGGVNVRYLGEISTRLSNRYFRLRAQQVSADGPEMLRPISILLSTLRMEMIARAMKIVVRRLLRNRSVARVANFISGALRYQAVASAMADGEKTEPKTPKGSMKQPKQEGAPSTKEKGEKSPSKTAKVVIVDASEDEDGSDEDVFQAEEDFFNCFDRTVWPVVDAKYGSGESFTILRFTPNQINVNPQVKFSHVDAVARIVAYLQSTTGITFAKKRAKWQSDVTAEVEFLDAVTVADEVVNGVARPGEFAEISSHEPLPVVAMPALPPLCHPSGESLHMIGVARSTVRTASLAVELRYLHTSHRRNTLFLSIVDLCALYCLDSGLTEDQDVTRWMKFRHEAVKRLTVRREALIRRQEAAESGDPEQEAVTGGDDEMITNAVRQQSKAQGEKGLEEYFVEPDVIGFPLIHASSGAEAVCRDVVLLSVGNAVLLDTFGVRHRDVLRVVMRPGQPPEYVTVVGCQKYLYVCAFAEAPVQSEETQTVDDEEHDGPPRTRVFALLVTSKEELQAQYTAQVVKHNGFIRYCDPTELGIRVESAEQKARRLKRQKVAQFNFGDGELVSTDDEQDQGRRLIGTDDRSDACYFFGTGWDVVEYNTKPQALDAIIPDVRSGHRILLTTSGATFRVIGVRDGKLWVCQERVDALPRPLAPSEFPYVTMLHLLDRVSYDEEVLFFMNRFFQRSLAALNKFSLYYGQKVLLRSGPLAGVVGIILGSEADTVQMLNITSKTIVAIPGRTHAEVFSSLNPLLVGCVLDLSVFEPIEPTTFACQSTAGERVILDIRAERLLQQFGVVQGSLVEILLGPFTLNKCRALGSTPGRLWVTLQLGDAAVAVGENAMPLKVGDYRVLSEAPVTVRKNPNRRLALRASDAQDPASLRLSAPLDPFMFLCATGIPVSYDRHSDVCGVFNLFHGQVVLVAKDVFAPWLPMTVVGVFQGELWVVPDGCAAAVPLDGFSGTELLQNYSIIEVRSHAQLFTFRDYLHIEGFEIMPFTVHSKVTRDAVMVHVLEENGELIGLSKADASFEALGLPEGLPLRFGDRVEYTLPEVTSAFLANASSLWKRRRSFEYYVVMGVYEGNVYAQKDGNLGCSILSLADSENMRVVAKVDVIPMSNSTIETIQRDLRMKKRKSADSDFEHRKTMLEDAMILGDEAPPLPFPPANMPNVTEAQLAGIISNVLDFAFHQFCERFAESKIPEASVRLVLHWMLQWFGCRLHFTDTKRDGLLKLAAIEEFVLKRQIPIPTLMDYDAFRVRREMQRRAEEALWDVPRQQLISWQKEAQLYCMPHTAGAQRANSTLRHMPALKDYVSVGEAQPAAALNFIASEEMRTLVRDRPVPVDRATLCKTSRAVLDLAQQRRRIAEQLAEVSPAAEKAEESPQAERLPQLIERAWHSALQQLRRSREALLAAQVAAGGVKRKVIVQDAASIHRYKTSEGGVIFLDSSDRACAEVFQMSRGDIFRYCSGDMQGIHIVVLGAVEGVLWRYEERLSSHDRIMDEQAHPFLGSTGDDIREHHHLTLVGRREPRSCDPFYFPRLEGALLKFDMEEASCAAFGVSHGQRYVVKKEPYIIPAPPLCRRGPVITVIGVYGQNIYFAADGSGAFTLNSNDPVKDLGLEPLYFTVVGAFAPERKNWFRCPVEVSRRGKMFTVSVCFDTSRSLIQLWHPSLRHGSLVRIPAAASDVEEWKVRRLSKSIKRRNRSSVYLDNEPVPTHVVAQVIGVRGNVLYRALLHDELARPFREDEWSAVQILTDAEAAEAWDGGPYGLTAPCKSFTSRAEKHLTELFQYVDTSGSDMGLVLRPPTKFKAFNTFHELCLYDQTGEAIAPWGVEAFTWVRIFVAQRWKWSVVVGVRDECLWRLDEDHIGVLSHELRFVPEPGDANAVAMAEAFAESERQDGIPVVSLFNHCSSWDDLVRNYSLSILGTAKLRGFVG